MKDNEKFGRVLAALSNFMFFFLLIGFVTTCCMMLFLHVMANSMNITFTAEMVESAAKITFANVMLLSFLLAVIYRVVKIWTVDRPAKRIVEAAEKMMHGDFSVRIPHTHTSDTRDKFNEIADCFNKMAEELARTEMLQSDFIANVSHELKTPLAIMKNYATMLCAPSLSEEKRVEYAGNIAEASARLASLVTNILRLNKLENQQITLNASLYDLGEQLCECLLAFEEVWEQKSLEIETEIEDGVNIRADAEMMSLVWNNLFSNAVKFTENGGKITLRVFAEGETAVVQISDTGVGISPEVGARIFDKFYQSDNSRATGGNGLGLALVKRVIDITGSDICVESAPGRGSTFTVKMQREI